MRFAFVSAQQVRERDKCDGRNEQARNNTTPDETIDHLFGFDIARAPRTTARHLRQHGAAIATGSCAYCHRSSA